MNHVVLNMALCYCALTEEADTLARSLHKKIGSDKECSSEPETKYHYPAKVLSSLSRDFLTSRCNNCEYSPVLKGKSGIRPPTECPTAKNHYPSFS